MDIGSGKSYPSCALSNFTPHPFVIDGVECSSMEGFLQALKFSNPEMQKHVCTLVGVKAKMKGKRKKWFKTQTLYWMGVEYKRSSEEYQNLITRAYDAMIQNDKFVNAIKASGNSSFTHSIGKNDISKTVLTEREFCGQLYRVRGIINGQK